MRRVYRVMGPNQYPKVPPSIAQPRQAGWSWKAISVRYQASALFRFTFVFILSSIQRHSPLKFHSTITPQSTTVLVVDLMEALTMISQLQWKKLATDGHHFFRIRCTDHDHNRLVSVAPILTECPNRERKQVLHHQHQRSSTRTRPSVLLLSTPVPPVPLWHSPDDQRGLRNLSHFIIRCAN